jgi:FtsZ-binding cell division protein ZapB
MTRDEYTAVAKAIKELDKALYPPKVVGELQEQVQALRAERDRLQEENKSLKEKLRDILEGQTR